MLAKSCFRKACQPTNTVTAPLILVVTRTIATRHGLRVAVDCALSVPPCDAQRPPASPVTGIDLNPQTFAGILLKGMSIAVNRVETPDKTS